MEDRLLREQGVGRPKVRDDPDVRLPHLLARIGAGFRREAASRVNGGKGGKAELLTELEILRPVARSGMDQPRVLGHDSIGGNHPVDPFPLRGLLIGKLRAKRVDICEPHEVAPFLRLDDGVFRHPGAGHDVGHRALHEPDVLRLLPVGNLHLRVPEVGMHRDRQIGRKGPRGRGPDQEGFVRLALEAEFDIDRWIRFVGVLDLGVRERRLASGTPLDRPERLVDPVAFVGAFQRPPGRLDEFVADRHVRAVPIQPDAERLELFRHLLQEVRRIGPAGVHELLDAELFDLLLVRDPEGLLDLDLDREAVHVVARLVPHVVAAHPVIADDEIFDRLVQDLSEVNRSGRIRRAVAEKEILAFLPSDDGLPIDLRPLPEFLDPLLHLEWSIRLLRLLDHRSPAPGDSGHPRLLHRLEKRSTIWVAI